MITYDDINALYRNRKPRTQNKVGMSKYKYMTYNSATYNSEKDCFEFRNVAVYRDRYEIRGMDNWLDRWADISHKNLVYALTGLILKRSRDRRFRAAWVGVNKPWIFGDFTLYTDGRIVSKGRAQWWVLDKKRVAKAKNFIWKALKIHKIKGTEPNPYNKYRRLYEPFKSLVAGDLSIDPEAIAVCAPECFVMPTSDSEKKKWKILKLKTSKPSSKD